VFAGAQEAIYAFMNVSLQAGDHVVAVVPAYQSLYEVARSLGADVTLLTLRPEERWQLNLDELERVLRRNTKVIAVNYPHSPTGSHLSRAELVRIMELTRDRGALLFADEVYRFAEFSDADRLPAGWIACRNAALLQRLQSFKHYLTICNSAPAEVLATIALRARARILERNRAIALENLTRLDEFFMRRADRFEWVRPQAGTVAFPRLRGEVSIDEFVVTMAEGAGVLLLPGTVFDYPGNHFRLGFGRRNLPVALARFEEFLDRSTTSQTAWARRHS
jgi:aspartate/methionine/tyrosine aminotransferase